MAKSDVVKKCDKHKEVYFCGRRYLVDRDGRLYSPGCVPKGRGKCGCETKMMRVPVVLVPAIEHFINVLQDIEDFRRNISKSVYNTSPDFEILVNGPDVENTLKRKEEAD